jgi:hypothetical protein
MEYRDNHGMTRCVAATLAAALLLLSGPALAQQKKVYRWVDEDGNVHYTESVPPEHRDSGHDVLNDQGLVVGENQRLTPQKTEDDKSEEEIKAEEASELPRDSSGLPRPKPLYTEAEKQQRMDNFLMLRYESEQEITDAMDVEIKQLNYDRRLIEGSQASIMEAWRGEIHEAANRQRAGQSVDDGVQKKITRLQSELTQNNRELAALTAREEKIRADFQAQLERYRFLLEKYAEEESS